MRGSLYGSEEFSRDTESDVPVFVVEPAARDLRRRRADVVREIELKDVAASTLLDTERKVIDTGRVSDARNVLADHIHGRTDAQASSDSEQESVVVVGEFGAAIEAVLDVVGVAVGLIAVSVVDGSPGSRFLPQIPAQPCNR